MIKPSAFFALSLVAGSAMAQSIPGLPAGLSLSQISQLTSALSSLGLPTGALPTGGTGGTGGLPSLPSGATGLPGLPSTAALPSLPIPAGLLPLGINATQPGADGSGNVQTLNLGNNTVLPNLTNPLTAGLTGNPGGPLQVGLIGGNGTANGGVGSLAAVSAISGNNTGNGAPISVGAINDNNTGNGQYLGVAALSQGGTNGTAPNGLGVNVLNQNNPLSISAGGQTVGANTLQQQAANFPGVDQAGIAINSQNATSSNPVANVSVLSDGGGRGGLLGAGVLSSNAANDAQVAGVGLLSKGNTANGSPIAADVLGGNNSGNGTAIGAGVISGDNAGNGGLIGAGVLAGQDSGNGYNVLGAGVLSGEGSGNSGGIGAGVLSGNGSGQGGTLGLGVLSGNGSRTNTGGNGGANGSNLGNNQKECAVTVRDAKGAVVRVEKTVCKDSNAVASNTTSVTR